MCPRKSCAANDATGGTTAVTTQAAPVAKAAVLR